MDQESIKRHIPHLKDKFNVQVERKNSESSRLHFNYNYSQRLSATFVSFGFIFVKTTEKENC